MKNYLQSLVGKKALVTGASSGIGKETALWLARSGVQVCAVARRENLLKKLQVEMPETISYFSGDINDQSFITELENNNAFDIDILINNAGLALGKSLFKDSVDEENDLVLNTNISSAFKIAKRALQKMHIRGSGDIVNICSISSHEVYSGGAVYCASKHAFRAMSKGLREETYGQNIRVISISPGLVETEFSEVRFKGDLEKAKSTYEGYTPLNPRDIAFQVIQSLQCPRHVNIDEVIILATDQAGASRVKKK